MALILAIILYLLLLSLAAFALAQDCHGRICQPIEEYCSAFLEGCDKCANICQVTSHNYQANTCARECADYNKFDPLRDEIHAIQTQQRIILLLLVLLLALIVVRYGYKCMRWLRHRRCLLLMLKKLQPKHMHQAAPGNANKDGVGDGGATTIRNVMTINETDRTTSQIYSVTGAEGSVMTMTTPVSTRYPAENSSTPTATTPTTVVAGAEHSYDNQALAVTPIAEKSSSSSSAHAF